MEETPFGEGGLSRRGLLKRGVAAGLGVSALGGLGAEAALARTECQGGRSEA